MRSALKTTFAYIVLSSLISLAAAVECAPADKNGSPLTGPNSASGDGFVTCTYKSGACTYFAENGTFSSGASTCPAGIPQSASGSGSDSSSSSTEQQQTTTTPAPTTSSTTSVVVITPSSSSAAVVTLSSSSTTTPEITTSLPTQPALTITATSSGFVTLSSSALSTSAPSTSKPASTGVTGASSTNSAVLHRGSIPAAMGAVGITLIVAAVNLF